MNDRESGFVIGEGGAQRDTAFDYFRPKGCAFADRHPIDSRFEAGMPGLVGPGVPTLAAADVAAISADA
ncbi:MAG TPA: hypothetical protein VEA61_09930 [Allosphingosinicella sp.]|nr:hypothetical protein [Allosphingosinicella sp.]